MPPPFVGHPHPHAHHHHHQVPHLQHQAGHVQHQVGHAHLFEQQILGADFGFPLPQIERHVGRAREEGGDRKKVRRNATSAGSASGAGSRSGSGSRESGRAESGAGSTAANVTPTRAKPGKRLEGKAVNGVRDSQTLHSPLAPAVKDVAHADIARDAGAAVGGGERIPVGAAQTVAGKRNFSDLTARDKNGRGTGSVGEGETGNAGDAGGPAAAPKPASKNLAYVNGLFTPAEEARVSITDLGFAYGCGVVEEVLVIGGTCVGLTDHLTTVVLAAKCLELPLPISANELRSVCMHVIRANNVGPRSALYIHLSFGTYGTRSRLLPPPSEIVPSVVIHTEELPPVPTLHLQTGIAVLPVSDSRRAPNADRDVAVPYLSSSSQLPVILALQKARSKNCVEALMVDHSSGDVTGTSAGNIFCVKFGAVYTPSAAGNSVMRRTIIKMCREELGIELREVSITQPFLCSATEVFCTSNLDQVVPVRAVGGRDISGQVPGSVTAQILDRFATMNAQLLTASKRQESSPIDGRGGVPGNGPAADCFLQKPPSVDGVKSGARKWKYVPDTSRPNAIGSNRRDYSSL